MIAIPSNGNTSNIHRDLEISHRISFAKEQLNIIRNLIAEKSFQFSHVIKVSPRKSITTRSRAAIRKLNNEIAERCRMYTRCRGSLFILGAENPILTSLKVLTPQDVTASTAILKPNEPGSTRIKLSWIWQSSSRHLPGSNVDFDMDAEADGDAEDRYNVLECGYIFLGILICFYLLSIDRRVHWLRARAQLMRWQEEVTLTTYEMQWTVRYFLHNCKSWDERARSLSEQEFQSPGSLAYAKRKASLWEKLGHKSDRSFRAINNAYKSPL